MRGATTAQAAVLASAFYQVALKVLIADGDGVMRDYSSQAGYNWIESVEVDYDIDQPVSQATVRLRRDIGYAGSTLSLAPFRTDSTLNRNGVNAFSPAIDSERAVAVQIATTAVGTAPISTDFVELFRGTIDQISWQKSPIEIIARDQGGFLVDRFVEKEKIYGTLGGTQLETVIQSILTDWAPGVTLYCPVSPGFAVLPYIQTIQSVMDACQALVQLIGWDLRYRWDSGTSAWRLTLTQPRRTASTPDLTIGPSRYIDVTDLKILGDNIRNVIVVEYTDSASGIRARIPATDATSIAKYGRRYMKISEPTRPINTAAQATALGAVVLADLKDPKADQTIEMHVDWRVELGDFDAFQANGRHYNTDQLLGIVSVKHTLSRDKHRTAVAVRGHPAGAYLTWLNPTVGGSAPVVAAPVPVITVTPHAGGTALQYDAALSCTGVGDSYTWDLSRRIGNGALSSIASGSSDAPATPLPTTPLVYGLAKGGVTLVFSVKDVVTGLTGYATGFIDPLIPAVDPATGEIIRSQPFTDGNTAAASTDANGYTLQSNVTDSSGLASRAANKFFAKGLSGSPDQLDSVPDGTTFSRPYASRINVGRPIIDFAESIHSNKVADYIGDGPNYRVIGLTESHQNLAPAQLASSTLYPNNASFQPTLAQLGLSVGDIISFSGLITNNNGTDTQSAYFYVQYYNGATLIGSNSTTYPGPTVTTETLGKLENATIPAGCDSIVVGFYTSRPGGAKGRRLMLNRGPRAIPFTDTPLRLNRDNTDVLIDGTGAPLTGGKFGSLNLDGTGVLAGKLIRGRTFDDGRYSPRAADAGGYTIMSDVGDYASRAINKFLAKGLSGEPDNIDSLSDGVSYARPYASRISVGKPLIDFSEGIHLNKSTDYIADATGTPLAGGRRGAIALDGSNNLVTGVNGAAKIADQAAFNVGKRAGSVFADVMDVAPTSTNGWTVSGAGAVVVANAGNITGKNIVRFAGAFAGIEWATPIAFNPNKLYRIRARIRTAVANTSGTSLWYVGLFLYDATGARILNSNSGVAYVCASSQVLTVGAWTEFIGWVKGASLALTSYPGAPSTDPTNPASLSVGTTQIAPMAYLGYNGSGGTFEMDYFIIDEYDEDASARTYGAIDPGNNLQAGVLSNNGSYARAIASGRIRNTGLANAASASFTGNIPNAPLIAISGGVTYEPGNVWGTAAQADGNAGAGGLAPLSSRQVDEQYASNITLSGYTVRARLRQLGGSTIARSDTSFSPANATAVGTGCVVTSANAPSYNDTYTANYSYAFSRGASAIHATSIMAVVSLDYYNGTSWVSTNTATYSASDPGAGYGGTGTSSVSGSDALAGTITGRTGTSQFRVVIQSASGTGAGVNSLSITPASLTYSTSTSDQYATKTPTGITATADITGAS